MFLNTHLIEVVSMSVLSVTNDNYTHKNDSSSRSEFRDEFERFDLNSSATNHPKIPAHAWNSHVHNSLTSPPNSPSNPEIVLTIPVPLLGIGGIHAISALVAIKFKLVLIFLAVMGTVFYGYKIYAGSSCPTPIISEHGGSILPFEGWVNWHTFTR